MQTLSYSSLKQWIFSSPITSIYLLFSLQHYPLPFHPLTTNDFTSSYYRTIRLTQCCTQFKSLGDKILCVLYLHYNVAFTFKWYGNSWNKTFYSQGVWIGYNFELAEQVYYLRISPWESILPLTFNLCVIVPHFYIYTTAKESEPCSFLAFNAFLKYKFPIEPSSVRESLSL